MEASERSTLFSRLSSKILTPSFFNRPTLEVTRDLLGKTLLRRVEQKTHALRLTELEAYDGFEDKASHAHRGQTLRNKVMFGPAGTWYVYLVYGMYWMLNLVTGPKNYPAAVLIRGVEGIIGPGRLTKFLHIDRTLNGKKANPKNALWIEDRTEAVPDSQIITTPRIGVDYAGPLWSQKHYRFILQAEKLQ
jgi:DNA-3-methyladenine glycosylase